MSHAMTEDRAPDGSPITQLTLHSGGATAEVMSWGGALMDLRLPGVDHPLVLGFDRPGLYLRNSPYFGATAGRYANRIGRGRFTLDGVAYQTDPNFLGTHTLHGGEVSMGKRNWDVIAVSHDSATMTIGLADGEMGFPGALRAEITYALMHTATYTLFSVDMSATTDRPTLCNLAHHSYWALDDSGGLDHHTLQVAADHYTPVDAELIPTGEIADVTGSRFDFRTARPILDTMPIDHNLCLSDARTPLRDVATLRSALSGLRMIVATTEPGLQVYDGAKVNVAVPGLEGRAYRAHAGVALEPQIWPDAPNHQGFPNAVLRPGETYRQTTHFKFFKD